MYARFGQELYTQETLAAARMIMQPPASDEARPLKARIADALPHPSPQTRLRVATKLLQRLNAGAASPCRAKENERRAATAEDVSPASLNGATPAEADLPPAALMFARLLAHLPDTQARCELVYYAASRADSLVGAIAQDILFPYFIDDRIPAPYSEDEFIMANAGLLLAPEPILTTGFVSDYARRVWGFECERTVGLALRILRQAGILLAAPLLGQRGRVAAYTLAPHGLSLSTLMWGLFDEFGQDNSSLAWDQVCRARIARQFVIPDSVAASRLWEAERAGLIGYWRVGGTRRITLKVREADALSRLLLSGPTAK